MYKVNQILRPGVGLDKPITGIADTFALKYKLTSESTWTVADAVFVENSPIFYGTSFSIPVAGEYDVSISSTNPEIVAVVNRITITTHDLADVYVVTEEIKATALDIKDTLDDLNIESINTLATATTGISNKLTEVIGMIGADNTGVQTLQKLLNDLKTADTDQNSVLTVLRSFTDDVEILLTGTSEFLRDGVTPNPLYGHSNAVVHAAISSSLDEMKAFVLEKYSALNTLIGDRTTAISNKLDTFQTYVADVVNPTLNSVNSKVSNNVYGLEAIRNVLTGLSDSSNSKFSGIENDLDSLSTSMTNVITLVSEKASLIINTLGNKIDAGASANTASFTDLRDRLVSFRNAFDKKVTVKVII